MLIVIFDEASFEKDFWIVDEKSHRRLCDLSLLDGHEILSNLSRFDSIHLESCLNDSCVYSLDFFGQDIYDIYSDVFAQNLTIESINTVGNLYPALSLALRECLKTVGHHSGDLLPPKLMLDAESRDYYCNAGNTHYSNLKFTSVEVAHHLSNVKVMDGGFERVPVKEIPSLRMFDDSISPFYTKFDNYYIVEILAEDIEDELRYIFQFNSEGKSLLPKNLFLYLLKWTSSVLSVETLYRCIGSFNSEDGPTIGFKSMDSISGWLTKGLINHHFCFQQFKQLRPYSVFYIDEIRVQTAIRARQLSQLGITVSSIGPFEVRCNTHADDLPILKNRAAEVGLYVAK
jgi:hypothetical protein